MVEFFSGFLTHGLCENVSAAKQDAAWLENGRWQQRVSTKSIGNVERLKLLVTKQSRKRKGLKPRRTENRLADFSA